MRLLHKTNVLLDLTDLGFSSRALTYLMDALIHRPDGIMLVTGPTRQRQGRRRSTPASTRSTAPT